jgi:cytochrome c oxidase accessory protein FixG
MWVEQRTEGSRNQRIKLDAQAWSVNKILRKSAKHCLWFGFAFYTGFTFVGYFTPIYELGYQFFTFTANHVEVFWVFLFAIATYINAGWMREQVCMYMCPYARFQSAMFDKNTLIVSYDKARGEPRGSRKHGEVLYDPENREKKLGDCIDCQLCVQVCPTGIDIRNGLQYQCIGCALCVDACDSVMEKMHYPKGLVRYTTENKLLGLPGKIIRPRVIGYSIAIAAMCLLLGYKLVTRIPLQLDVIRDRGQLYIERDDGSIENGYTLNIMNMDNDEHRYRVSVSGMKGISILGATDFSLQSGEIKKIPLRLSFATHGDDEEEGENEHGGDIYFSVQALDNEKLHARHKSRFILK